MQIQRDFRRQTTTTFIAYKVLFWSGPSKFMVSLVKYEALFDAEPFFTARVFANIFQISFFVFFLVMFSQRSFPTEALVAQVTLICLQTIMVANMPGKCFLQQKEFVASRNWALQFSSFILLFFFSQFGRPIVVSVFFLDLYQIFVINIVRFFVDIICCKIDFFIADYFEFGLWFKLNCSNSSFND